MFNRRALLPLLIVLVLNTVTACSTLEEPLDFPNGKNRLPVNVNLKK